MLRFADFEIDQQRAELRRVGGEAIKLRPKSFKLLTYFTANTRRILTKQELIEAIWPNIYVGEDSLFQCIREIRAALGDDQRQTIKNVSGQGYLFEADVCDSPIIPADPKIIPAGPESPPDNVQGPAPAGRDVSTGGVLTSTRAVIITAVLAAVVALAVFTVRDTSLFARPQQTFAVLPIATAGHDPQIAEVAANVTDQLVNGLAKIPNIQMVTPQGGGTSVSRRDAAALESQADFVITAELQKDERGWKIQARVTTATSHEVLWTTAVSVEASNTGLARQQSRLAAGLGYQLAVRINALVHSGTTLGGRDGASTGNAKLVVEQANAFINRTSPERFRASQVMLEGALARDPDNIDLKVALAAQLLRGIQTAWYSPAEAEAAQTKANAILESTLRAKPNYIPAVENYCRFLTATNRFIESLVACAKALELDPWDGTALFQLGLTQAQLGRFEDALATFGLADLYDTPAVSRWTWLLGSGMTYLLMGQYDEAAHWLERSIAITPGTGRTHFLLAAAYLRLGRTDEAKAAFAKALQLRPHSTVKNIALPSKNASPIFLDAAKPILAAGLQLGLPAE